MSQEKAVRIPLRASSGSRRTLDERLVVRFPALAWVAARVILRLPVRSRLRCIALARGIRRGYAATSRGDFELALVLYDPDVEIHARDSGAVAVDLVGVYRGHDGWHRLVSALLDVWELGWKPEEVLDCGDRAVVTLRIETRGRGSGIALSSHVFDVLTFRNGRVTRQEICGDRDEALEAAGLSE